MIRITVTLVVVGFMGFLQACSTTDPKPFKDPISVYKDGMEQGNKAMLDEVRSKLKQKSAYGSVEPYNPLRLPPDIRKVWIVEHPNEAGDLIQGHWVFMVVAARTLGIAVGTGASSAERDENAKRYPDDRGQTRPDFSRHAEQTE